MQQHLSDEWAALVSVNTVEKFPSRSIQLLGIYLAPMFVLASKKIQLHEIKKAYPSEIEE